MELKYAGVRYCKECFKGFFENRVRKTIIDNEYFKGAKKIAVGLSGGKDSSAMLYIMDKIIKENASLKGIKLITISIDGGIPSYDSENLKNARLVCEKLGIEQHIFSFKEEFDYTLDEIAKARPNLCNCGIFRRYLLNKKSRELDADRLAIGHNLDDEAESILMNVIQGDIKKLAKINKKTYDKESEKTKKFIPRIKPLQRCPENEVLAYAKLIYPNLDFDRQCPYKKEVFRANIKKALDMLEEKHSGIKFQILESSNKLRDALASNKDTSSNNNDKINLCKKCGEICANEICQACDFHQKIKETLKNRRLRV